MELFSNEVSSTLQYFTFPLEVVGLTLAAIEVRFPQVASRINSYLLEEEDYQGRMSQKSIVETIFRPEVPPVGPLRKLSPLQMRVFTISMLGIGCFIFLLVAYSMYQEGHYLPALMTVVLLIAIIASFKQLSRVGSVVYRFINDWVPGRTVGTLGIIIAGIGVLGEAYQFTTQLVV